MVVQTLRIEIQPVSGKGIEVRDDRKTRRLIGCPRRLATGPTAPGASTMAKVSPVRGGGHAALMRYRRPMPQRVLLLMATGAGAGVQVRIPLAATLASFGFSRGMS